MKKRVAIYGIGIFFSKILVFLMVPIYARVFSQGDFGYYDVITSDMQMVVSITFMEIWSGVIRFMIEDKDKYRSVKTVLCMMPGMLALYAVGILILNLIVEIKYPVMIILYGIMYLLFNVSNNICRGLEKNTDYVISGLISTFVSCSLSIVFAVYMHLGIEYLFLALSIGYLLASIFVELKTHAYRHALKTGYKKGSIKEMSMYCIPLMLNAFSFMFLGTYNKNIIINTLGEDVSGTYALIIKFSSILSVFLSIYTMAWQEQAFVSAGIDDRDNQYSHYINEFFKLVGTGVPVYLMACVIASPIYGGEKYFGSEIYLPLAVLACFISGIYGIFGTVIAVNKKTHFVFISTMIGAIFNVVIATLTIARFGINAASASLAIGSTVISLLSYVFAVKDFKLRLHCGYLGLMLLEVTAVMVVLYTLGSHIIINALLGMAFALIWLAINRNSLKGIAKAAVGKITGK